MSNTAYNAVQDKHRDRVGEEEAYDECSGLDADFATEVSKGENRTIFP